MNPRFSRPRRWISVVVAAAAGAQVVVAGAELEALVAGPALAAPGRVMLDRAAAVVTGDQRGGWPQALHRAVDLTADWIHGI